MSPIAGQDLESVHPAIRRESRGYRLEDVGARRRGLQDRDVGVPIEAVAGSAHGAHDVLVLRELDAKASDVHVDRALVRDLLNGSVAPQRLDDLLTGHGAALAQDEVLQQLELLEGERGHHAIEQQALARQVDDDAGAGAILLVLDGLLASVRGRIPERKANYIDIAAAGALGGNGDGRVGFGGGGELCDELLQLLDDRAEAGVARRDLGVGEPDVQGKAANLGALRKCAGCGRGGLGSCGSGEGRPDDGFLRAVASC